MAKKKLTFLTLVADVFKEKLAEAGYRTIVKGFRGEDHVRVHIRGSRKRHVINIRKITHSGHTKYTIDLDSDRLRRSYELWRSGDFRIEDPRFVVVIDTMVDNVVKFMGHIAKINEHLLAADAIFDDESGGPRGAFNPAKKRVSRTHV